MEVELGLFLRQLPDPVHLRIDGGSDGAPDAGRFAHSRLLALLGRSQADVGELVPRGSHLIRVPCELSIGPDGGGEGLRLVGLPSHVRTAARAFPRVGRVTYGRARSMVNALARELDLDAHRLNPDLNAIVVLADVSWGGGELLAAALATAGTDLPLVGGTFDHPGLALDGVDRRGGAVVVLLDSEVPLAPFLVHPYRLTDIRTVVTRCDASGHLVSELDGRPACERFCELIEVSPDALRGSPDVVLQRLPAQLAWMVAGRPVTRPVVGAEDGALELAGAVQRGTVLRVITRDPDVAGTVIGGVSGAIAALPVPGAAAWAFGCTALFRGPDGPAIVDGLARIGVIAAASRGIVHGPVHTCGGVCGLVVGDAGS